MKLFLSYSRDDKAWVYELWRSLRDRLRYDPWIDLDIKGASNWWESILEAIEEAECVIYIMTPKSTESIFCRAEITYALALNKPILPLMLKTAPYLPELNARHIQYETIIDQMALSDVLLTISNNMMDIVRDIDRGKYVPVTGSRPDVPQPQANNPDHIFEVFALAEEAAAEDNFPKAESLFHQVIKADPDGLGLAAQERLAEIKYERDRATAYRNVMRLAVNPDILKGAQAAWRTYVSKYGSDYDPQTIAAKLDNAIVKPPSPSAPPVATKPAVSAPTPPPLLAQRSGEGQGVRAKPRSKVYDILPAPFEWIDIPAGKVTLTEGGYVPKGGQSFDVPAFAIAKYPTTNAQFAKFIEAGGYEHEDWWTDKGWAWKDKDPWKKPHQFGSEFSDIFNHPDHPVVGISWHEAVAFCLWLSEISNENIVLPTEQQWQRAAQGDDKRIYPWGNKWNPIRCNNNVGKNPAQNVTSAVSQYEGKDKGNSYFDVVDMAGNVWEWCLTEYETGKSEIEEHRINSVLRGGSWWGSNTDSFRVDLRGSRYGHLSNDMSGFRCCLLNHHK